MGNVQECHEIDSVQVGVNLCVTAAPVWRHPPYNLKAHLYLAIAPGHMIGL